MKLESTNKITILALSWRDIKAPKMGGAEICTHEMMSRADLNQFRFIHFSPEFDGSIQEEIIDNITYIRKGNLLSVINESRKFYKENRSAIDYVIDQCNTHRFFTRFWVDPKKRIFFIHQLTREIWGIHMKFPFSIIGMFMETYMLKLNKNDWTITVSESTKKDLEVIDFIKNRIKLIPVGLNFKPWANEDFCVKEAVPTFIYVGRYAKYKGIDISVQAFGELKKTYKDAKMWIVGKKDEEYIQSNLIPLCAKYKLTYGNTSEDKDIVFHGFVEEEKKLELMSRAHALLFPSIREGWGLIVTEAAAVGTPSIVFNSPGTIDAVDFGNAGYLCEENTYIEISRIMKNVLEDTLRYEEIQKNAFKFSSQFNWDITGKVLTSILLEIHANKS